MKSKLKNYKSSPDNKLELALLSQGYKVIIGVDEVGRGSWAGPVYLGAYLYTLDTPIITEVNDSKLVSPAKRQQLYSQLILSGQYHCEIGSVATINQYGIGKTITKLIENMLEKFKDFEAYYLIDGYFKQNFGANTRQIIKGDMKHYAISAASILAKVERDSLMSQLALDFPSWNFANNKGYGTQDHIAAIQTHGISPIHRLNYKPIQKFTNGQFATNNTTTNKPSNR